MIVGIDPGKTGGVAVLGPGGEFKDGMRMPIVTHGKRDLVDTAHLQRFVSGVVGRGVIRAVVIEAPNSMPRQGLQSTFNFGRHCGAVEGWAMSTGRPLHLVTPAVWKKAFGLSTDKRASLDRARLEFGDLEIWRVLANDGCAEAALIALWWATSASAKTRGQSA